MPRKQTGRRFVLFVRHDVCEDLERWKVYHILRDEKAERMVYLLNRPGEHAASRAISRFTFQRIDITHRLSQNIAVPSS